ncbi:MAG: 30S ribosomal protein S15 [Chloroflexota bacterium]|nr:30S ribosomal protein S15 [Chloroflexota bacterium]
MPLMKQQKEQIITEYATHEGDTGSAQVQIALLTARIHQLTEHLKNYKQDQHSRRGLLKLVGERRRHLRYLSRTNADAYHQILQRLGLRR